MPVSRSIDDHLQIVRAVWTGDTTAAELEAGIHALLVDERLLAIGRELADLRAARFPLTGIEIDFAFATSGAERVLDRPWRVALLAGSPEQFGVARQFVAFADGLVDGAVFTSEPEAIAWLLR